MEIPFSIPITGVINLDGDTVTITVRGAETKVDVPFPTFSTQYSRLEPGKSMDSVILEAAREYIKTYNENRFTGPDLFAVALDKNSRLNRRSFLSRVVAVTPNHPSYHHFASGKDYFKRIDKGVYELNDRYKPNPNLISEYGNE